MKSLLSMLAVGVLATSITTPLVSQSVIKVNSDTSQQALQKLLYYNPGEKEEEILNTYKWNDPKLIRWSYTFNIGGDSVSNYKDFEIIDPNYTSYTKTSWGNDAYWGESLWTIKGKIEGVFLNEKVSNDKISSKVTNLLLNRTVKDGMAELTTRHGIGFAYYSEGENNFVQVFGYQYAVPIASFSGGAMWTNLGQGIALYK